MARQIVVDIVGDSSKFSKATKDATDGADHLGVSFKTLSVAGLAVGAASSLTSGAMSAIGSAASMAASAVIDFGVSSVAAASDLNETISKSNVIFGEGATAVETWAKTMATAGGLSERAALDAASGFAGLFKVVGIGVEQSTKMSEELTQMGSDLASFFNTDVDTALNALKSGLNGEAEPLRQFNIFLSETAVSAKLAEMGIKKVGGQFTEQQKATARYALILEQTTDAQGDFVRTSDGLANSQRQVSAEIENLQAEIGQQLLPIVKDLTIWVKNDFIPALDSALESAGAFGEGMNAVSFALDSLTKGPMVAAQNAADKLALKQAQIAGEKTQEHVDELKAKMAAATGVTSALGDAMGSTSTATSTLSGKVGTLTSRVHDTADALHTARDKVNDLSDAFLEAAFAPAQLKLELQSTNLELGFQKRHLKDLEDQYDKHPTKKLEKDIVDLKLQISESTQKGEGLRAKIAALDGTTTAEVTTEVKRVGKAADNARPEVNDLTGAVKDLERAAQKASDEMFRINNVVGGPSSKPRASGGPVVSGGVYTVGEHGPETLVMGSGAGYVLPHGSMSGGGGGGTGAAQVININIASFTGSDRDIDHFADRLALRMRLAGA